MTSDYIAIEGSPYIVPAADKGASPFYLKYGTIKLDSERKDLECVTSLLTPESVVLDIGAFIGGTVAIFLERTPHVLAFEPFPDAFHCLQHNTSAICFNVPIGNGRTVRLNADTLNGKGNLGTRRTEHASWRGGKGANVDDLIRTMRIDDLALGRVDAIKLDVEGFEVLALQGMSDTLVRHRPIFYIEIFDEMLGHNGHSRADVYALLASFNYTWSVATGTDEGPNKFDILAVPQ